MRMKVLISACLLGMPVRYDGACCAVAHPILARWRREGRLVALCPEVEAGLPVPRPRAEIAGGAGAKVLRRCAHVVNEHGADLTPLFRRGAALALRLVRAHRIRVAVLKAKSPSCGVGSVYDGSFTGRLVVGDGVVAAALARHRVRVFTEAQLEAADAALRALEAG